MNPKSQIHRDRPQRTLATSHGELMLGRRCLLMAILNITPDSFSDGGRYLDPAIAADRAMASQASGADMLDIGGESTRPGSAGVSSAEQIGRVVPVIRAARTRGLTIPISIDTRSAEVAAAALDAGADIINDVSGARHDPAMPGLLARAGVPFVIMHMLGTPETMQNNPRYDDVVAEVGQFFDHRETELAAAGVDTKRNMIVDPGIGFGKTVEHNLELLRRAADAYGSRRPVLIGPSRKRFLGRIAGDHDPANAVAASSERRLMATAAAVSAAALSGVDMIRVHDVAEMRAVLDVCEAISDR